MRTAVYTASANIDHNKLNNSYANLELITHSENMIKARAKKEWNTGRPKGYKASIKTRLKMAEKKHKKVRIFNDTTEIIYSSVTECCKQMKIYEKKLRRAVNSIKTVNGFYIRYL